MMRMEITFEQRNTTLFATMRRDDPRTATPAERAAHDRIWNALVRFCNDNKIGLATHTADWSAARLDESVSWSEMRSETTNG